MSEINASAEQTTSLSEGDRERLAYHLSKASSEVFPADERIGKTLQQDFYFRELLDVLIDNALKHGIPCAGGTLIELWRFTREKIAKWRMNPNARKGRSGYERDSIKTLVHEWSTAFARFDRGAESANGRIEFFLETPGRQSDDVVLHAAVVGLNVPDSGTFEHTSKALTATTRLPAEIVVESGEDANEKHRLVLEARKYARRVEAQYLAKLSDAPLEFVQEQVKELRRAQKNNRRLALAVLAVVATGMAAYKIFFSQHPVIAVFPMSGRCSGCPSNIDVNEANRIAVKSSSGDRLTEWADAIVGPDGSSVRVQGRKADGTADVEFTVPGKGVIGNFQIPMQWHERADVVLARRVACLKGYPEHGFMCFVLVDLRAFDKMANTDKVTVWKWHGDTPDAYPAFPMTINAMTKTRVAIWVLHRYSVDGVYEAWLATSSDPRLQSPKEAFVVKPSDMRRIRVARVLVRGGDVVDVRPDESSPVQ